MPKSENMDDDLESGPRKTIKDTSDNKEVKRNVSGPVDWDEKEEQERFPAEPEEIPIEDMISVETCEICYDEYYIAKNFRGPRTNRYYQAIAGKQHGASLACKHYFCRNCFMDHFKSLVEEQGRFENLCCPHHGCT